MTLKSQCVQLVSDTGIETVPENFLITESSPTAKRTLLWVAALLFSVIVIYLLGYTFNFMVMFGMLLGLGMLIDGAIVVTEYADRRMSEGADHKAA